MCGCGCAPGGKHAERDKSAERTLERVHVDEPVAPTADDVAEQAEEQERGEEAEGGGEAEEHGRQRLYEVVASW